QVGDKEGEATTLNNIGMIYDALGEKAKALDFFNQALPLYRQVGDKGGEAITIVNVVGTYLALDDRAHAIEAMRAFLLLYAQLDPRVVTARGFDQVAQFFESFLQQNPSGEE